jgi:hypothetical protein
MSGDALPGKEEKWLLLVLQATSSGTDFPDWSGFRQVEGRTNIWEKREVMPKSKQSSK